MSVAVNCERCGLPKIEAANRCKCPPRAYSMRAEPATITIGLQPAGLIVEGPPDDPNGRRVEARPASGGKADSVVTADGSFGVTWAGALDRGRAAEGRAVKTLIQAMKATGLSVERATGARDDRGEDGRLLLAGVETPLQCVSVPVDPGRWAALQRQGELRCDGTADDAVALIRNALEHKRSRARGTILLLDMSQVGAVITEVLVRRYRESYPDPEHEFDVVQVWLVGPTTRSTLRLGGAPRTPA